MLRLIFCIIICCLCRYSVQQDVNSDLQTLSELPLENLIKLQNNFNVEDVSEDSLSTRLEIHGNDTPEALALQSKMQPINRGGHGGGHGDGHDHGHDHGSDVSNKKDINSIFQMSVTALAFIAFGGYLLCLIVHAIQAKKNAQTTTTTMAMLVRPNRIRNGQRPVRRPRPGNNRYKREIPLDANPHEMYSALLFLAEGYSKYHTISYDHLNTTLNLFK